MENRKILFYPIINTTDKCSLLFQIIKEKLKDNLTDNISKADMILVWGWDWFMLDTIKKYWKHWKPFFWVNCWTLWFLMNHISDYTQLLTSLDEFEVIQENLFQVEIEKNNWTKLKRYWINDIVIWNNILDYVRFELNIEWERLNINWTWLILSSTIWSTWYWLWCWYPILPLKSSIWWIWWIATNPFKFQIVEQNPVQIVLNSRTKINIWIDWYWTQIKDIKSVIIKPSKIIIKICFLKSQQFEIRRIKIFQEKMKNF